MAGGTLVEGTATFVAPAVALLSSALALPFVDLKAVATFVPRPTELG
jgi:hypothetical protein